MKLTEYFSLLRVRRSIAIIQRLPQLSLHVVNLYIIDISHRFQNTVKHYRSKPSIFRFSRMLYGSLTSEVSCLLGLPGCIWTEGLLGVGGRCQPTSSGRASAADTHLQWSSRPQILAAGPVPACPFPSFQAPRVK